MPHIASGVWKPRRFQSFQPFNRFASFQPLKTLRQFKSLIVQGSRSDGDTFKRFHPFNRFAFFKKFKELNRNQRPRRHQATAIDKQHDTDANFGCMAKVTRVGLPDFPADAFFALSLSGRQRVGARLSLVEQRKHCA